MDTAQAISACVGTAVPQVEITLGRPRVLRGRVVDTDGKPVAGAFIDPDVWKGYRCLGTFLWTNADGRFRWDDAPNDELTVNVHQQGYIGVFQQRVLPSVEETVFTLTRCLPVDGTVRDAETKKRIEQATLEFGAVDTETGEVLKWVSPPRAGFRTGISLGELRIDLPIKAESYKIRVQCPGYQTFVSRAFRREEKAVIGYEVMLVPGKPKGPVATVLRPDGKPLAGARVYCATRGKNLILHDGVVVPERVRDRGIFTSAAGTFPIPQHEERFMVLILADDAYAIATNKTLAESPKVSAMPYGRIDGRYFTGSRGVAKLPIELSGSLQGETVMACRLTYNQKVTTGLLGGFTLRTGDPDAWSAHRPARPIRDAGVGLFDRRGRSRCARRDNPGQYRRPGPRRHWARRAARGLGQAHRFH